MKEKEIKDKTALKRKVAAHIQSGLAANSPEYVDKALQRLQRKQKNNEAHVRSHVYHQTPKTTVEKWKHLAIAECDHQMIATEINIEGCHAEIGLMNKIRQKVKAGKLSLNVCKRMTMIVVRINSHGEVCNSKPCESCQPQLNVYFDRGFLGKVIWTTGNDDCPLDCARGF